MFFKLSNLIPLVIIPLIIIIHGAVWIAMIHIIRNECLTDHHQSGCYTFYHNRAISRRYTFTRLAFHLVSYLSLMKQQVLTSGFETVLLYLICEDLLWPVAQIHDQWGQTEGNEGNECRLFQSCLLSNQVPGRKSLSHTTPLIFYKLDFLFCFVWEQENDHWQNRNSEQQRNVNKRVMACTGVT